MKKSDECGYLRQDRLRALYPPLTQSAKESLCNPQRYPQLEEGTIVKRKLSVSLVLSMVVVALVAAALAEVTTNAFSRFFAEKDIEMPSEASALLSHEEPLYQHDFGDVVVTILQAASDGRNLFVEAMARPKPGSDVLLMSDSYEGDPTSPDTREAYWSQVKDSGKQVLALAITPQMQTDKGITSFGLLEDGAAQLVSFSRIQATDPEPQDLALRISVASYGNEGEPVFGYLSTTWTGPVKTLPTEVRTVHIHEKLQGVPVTLETMRIYRTALSMYYDIDFRMATDFYRAAYTDQGAYMLDDDVLLHLFDASGKEIQQGYEYAMGGSLDGAGSYQQSGSFSLQAFPEEIFIKALDRTTGNYSQAVRVEIPPQ